MPIIATRDGTVVSSTPITPEQREQLWAAVFRAFIKNHPELIREDIKEEN